jgi:hypothetical protein
MKRFVQIVAAGIVLELFLVVVSGGVSVFGAVGATGFTLRLALALILIALHAYLDEKPARTGKHLYLVFLLLLLPLLHFRGYRLRGDSLWYYAYAHSIIFDGDIDLTNQYERLGIDHFTGSQKISDTGLARFAFPVGAPLAWLPFIELGHLGAWVRNAHGIRTVYDGFSDPYLHAVALGNLLIGWLGLLILDRFLRRWFSAQTAFIATLGTVAGSFLLWYITYQAAYTHALTFLLICLLLDRWVAEPERVRDYAILGLLVGAAICVRWQSGIFALLPALSLGTELARRRWRFVASSAAAFVAAVLIGVTPQLITWKIIFDRFYIGVPLGAEFMEWSSPFLTEVLLSSRHGLFSWSPILLFSLGGFLGFVWRRPRQGLPLFGLLLFLTYVNSVAGDWWAGGAFGSRRFDSALPILALGLATAVSWATELVRRRPGLVVTLGVGCFIGANLLFMEQYRKGRLPPDDTISWETAARGMLEDVFDAVGYPFSFPANWAFARRYDRPKTQYDILVGKYLFHRMGSLGGVIDLGATDPPFIGNGWSGVKDWDGRPRGIRLAEGPRAGIFVPTARAETLRIFITCAAPRGTEPQWIEVWLNGYRLGGFLPGFEMKEHPITADTRWWQRINLLELVSPESSEGPYLAVDRLRFERLQR